MLFRCGSVRQVLNVRRSEIVVSGNVLPQGHVQQDLWGVPFVVARNNLATCRSARKPLKS
jgi:hypothetical protein